MSSFMWTGLVPNRSVVAQQTTIKFYNVVPTKTITYTNTSDGENKSSLEQTIEVTVSESEAQTVTVTSTETEIVNYQISATVGYEPGDMGGITGSMTLDLGYSFEQSKQTQNSSTDTFDLSVTQEIEVPADCSYTVTATVSVGEFDNIPYSTRGDFVYDQPIDGSTPDPTHPGWYISTQTLTGYLSGGLQCNEEITIETKPLPFVPLALAAEGAVEAM
jgi:hypothetical protein